MKKKPRRKTSTRDPLSEVVKLLDRVVTQAQLTQFQIGTINMRLSALEKLEKKAARP